MDPSSLVNQAKTPLALEIQNLRSYVKCQSTDWSTLLVCVNQLPLDTTLSDLKDIGYEYLPDPKPSLVLFDLISKIGSVESANANLLGVGTDIHGTGDNSVFEQSSSSSSSNTSANQDQRSKRRKVSSQQLSFASCVSKFGNDDAINAIRNNIVSSGTNATYAPSISLYEQVAQKASFIPFPLTFRKLESFAGYLKLANSYSNPAVHLWSVVHHNKQLGYVFKDSISDLVKALERGLPAEEQAEPFTVKMWRQMGEVVESDHDFDTLLSIMASTFTLARIDSFLHLSLQDVSFDNSGAVEVSYSSLKGSIRDSTLTVKLESTDTDIPPLNCGKFGMVPVDPPSVFAFLYGRAKLSGSKTISSASNYSQFSRRLEKLLLAAGFDTHVDGRKRAVWTTHSSKVTGVCMLAKAGLPEFIISNLANWSSQMIGRYSRRVSLQPDIVEALKFYNPKSLASSYTGCLTECVATAMTKTK